MLDLIESSGLFPSGRPTPQNRFSCCDCSPTQNGLWQVCELIQPAFTMFPGRRPPRAVEPRSKDHRYLDNQSFAHNLKNSNKPTFLGLNIQSLHSKYFNLKSFILSNEANGPPISLIALQETWNIQDTNAINIPTSILYFKKGPNLEGAE